MKKVALLVAALAVAASANAQVDWTTSTITKLKSFTELAADAGLTGNVNAQGVYTDGTNLFVIVENAGAPFATVIVRYDLPAVNNPVVVADLDALDDDSDHRLSGAFKSIGNELIVADFNEVPTPGGTSLIGVLKTAPFTYRVIRDREDDLRGLGGFDPINSDTLVVSRTLSNGGDGSIRTVNTTSGVVSGVLVPAAAIGTANAIAYDPDTGDVYVSDTNGDRIRRIVDLLGTPAVSDATPAAWVPPLAEAEVRNLIIGPGGALISSDRGAWANGTSIRVAAGTTSVVITDASISTAVGDTNTFSTRDSRGLSVVSIGPTQADLYAANFTSGAQGDAAVLRIRFGTTVSSVANWNMY